MNPTLRFLQKQGLKVSLPLLLLATACGDGGTTSAFQPNSAGAAGGAITAASKPNTNGMGAPITSGAGFQAANVTLPDNADQTPTKAVPTPSPTSNGGTSGGGSTGVTPGAGVGAGAAASVPEPAALAGLAIAAAGMIVLKRKQAA